MADELDFKYVPPTRPVWPLVLVGVAVVLLAVSVGAYFYLRDSLAPRIMRKQDVTRSLNNLRQMAQLLAFRAPRKGYPPYTGKRLVVSLIADGVIDVRDLRNVEIFFSPADPDRSAKAVPPERWQAVTRAALDAGLDVDELTSYVGPSVLLGNVPDMQTPVLADLHFEDVILVAFAGGWTREMSREDLGLGPDDPIEVGEAAKSPILRGLSNE
jgi:hypothetical protein